MAKKEEIIEENQDFEEEYEENEGNDDGKKKGKKGCLIMLIFSIVIIGILVAILGFNAGGIRDKYLRSTLEKIPIVKNWLPELEETSVELEEEDTISAEQETIERLNTEIEELTAEINRLKAFEEGQLQFKEEKEEFDRLIALNDANAYANFYESIYPENAEKLYQEAVQKVVTDKEFKEYINTFENMKKATAATILEELITTDIDLVISILENLSTTHRADILSSMSSANAAICIKLLSPDDL